MTGTNAAIGAFFDMDLTVLSASSGRLYLQYLLRTGRLSWWRWANISRWVAGYMLGSIEFPHLMSRLMAYASDADVAETWKLSEQWYDDVLRHYIAPGARERIAWHRELGHHVAIISAATPYAVRMVAKELGCGDSYLATELEIVDGRFSGRVVEPACFGPGKLILTKAYAGRHRLDLDRSYFYSDSDSDLPLLEAVGHPVAVNPNRKLSRIAASRNWKILRFY